MATEVRKMEMNGAVPAPKNMGEAMELAKLLASSSFIPKPFANKPGDVLAAIMMGAELGLKPMAALQNIAVINGRPAVWGDAMLAIARAHPFCEDVIEEVSGEGNKMVATCTIKRRGQSAVVRTFSVEDAKQAGLWNKSGPWQTYPKRMLQMRARAFALRDAFPDLLRGLSVAEEVMDIEQPAKPAVVNIATKGKEGLKARLRDRRPTIDLPEDTAETAEPEVVEAEPEAVEAEPEAVEAEPEDVGKVADLEFYIKGMEEAKSLQELQIVAEEASATIQDAAEREKAKARYILCKARLEAKAKDG